MSSGIVFAALLAGHWVGDRWAQTDHQSAHKGHTGWVGRRACASRVATLTLCQMAALALVGLDQLSRLGRASTRKQNGIYVVLRNN